MSFSVVMLKEDFIIKVYNTSLLSVDFHRIKESDFKIFMQ
jgi:hypothetical protein